MWRDGSFHLQPGDRLYLEGFYSKVRDGSFHLLPGERLSEDKKKHILVRDGSLWRDGSFHLQPGDRLYLEGFYSKVRDGSFHLQPGERLFRSRKLSRSETDHCGETDLSTANPVSASPEDKKTYPGPRRIIVERRIFPPPAR